MSAATLTIEPQHSKFDYVYLEFIEEEKTMNILLKEEFMMWSLLINSNLNLKNSLKCLDEAIFASQEENTEGIDYFIHKSDSYYDSHNFKREDHDTVLANIVFQDLENAARFINSLSTYLRDVCDWLEEPETIEDFE